MKVLPKQNIEFISPLSKSELYDKLNENIEYIEKLKIIGIRHNSYREYEGHIENDLLTFRRISKQGANSFIPILSGNISEIQDGTKVELSARLHKIIERFFIGYNLFLLILFLLTLISFDNRIELYNSIFFLIGIIFMFFVSNGAFTLIFSFELYRMEKFFRSVLRCENKPSKNINNVNRKFEVFFLGV